VTRVRDAGGRWPAAGQLPRLLPVSPQGGPVRLTEHVARYGTLPAVLDEQSRTGLIREVEAAGLTGRGGAGFPTARKLSAIQRGRPTVVIANGTEGEPAIAKDKILLTFQPHLVLDGAVLAAGLIRASEAIIVAHRAALAAVAAAARERRAAGVDGIRLRVMPAADRFVGGEATAVANWVHRGIARPLAVPPRLTDSGPDGRATLVQNAETLAHLALIARYGASWFRSLGSATEPGSTLVTLTGAVARPGVYEIAVGTPLDEVLRLSGGATAPLAALLIGGYSGSWIPAAAMTRPFSMAGLEPVGAAPGAGLIAAFPAHACGLAETARIASYLADQSAGQCGPCVFGLASIAREVTALAGGCPWDRSAVDRWLDQVATRGACRHPAGAVRLVRSALVVFSGEVARHGAGWCCGMGGFVLPVPGSE
jgi:NADH:ubiquinone oxidoreductase subunit F (NADH-binding)